MSTQNMNARTEANRPTHTHTDTRVRTYAHREWTEKEIVLVSSSLASCSERQQSWRWAASHNIRYNCDHLNIEEVL